MVNTFTALDVETTGLVPGKDKIIEIGAVKVVDGCLKEKYSELINQHIKLPENIIQLTGITDQMLYEAKEEKQVMSGLRDFLGDDILLGHNILFDYSFLKVYYKSQKINFESLGIDTLLLSRIFHQDLCSRSLENMCKCYGIEHSNAHRAYHDAMASYTLYFRLYEKYGVDYKDRFSPKPLMYKVPKVQSITNKQKNYLLDLLKYHKINTRCILGESSVDTLTKSQASKMIDRIILNYGRIL